MGIRLRLSDSGGERGERGFEKTDRMAKMEVEVGREVG